MYKWKTPEFNLMRRLKFKSMLKSNKTHKKNKEKTNPKNKSLNLSKATNPLTPKIVPNWQSYHHRKNKLLVKSHYHSYYKSLKSLLWIRQKAETRTDSFQTMRDNKRTKQNIWGSKDSTILLKIFLKRSRVIIVLRVLKATQWWMISFSSESVFFLTEKYVFIFYLFCLFFKWYADFKIENLKRKIKQTNA